MRKGFAMAAGTYPSETAAPSLLDGDTDKLYEVVDGRVVEKPPTGALQSVLASDLVALLNPIARSNRLGRVVAETLFLIDRARDLKRRPDIAFVSAERWPLARRVPGTDPWDVIPALTVEVISKSNAAEGVVTEIEEYFHAGVTMVWIVYPVVSKVYVYDSPSSVRILGLDDELDGGALVPGFRVPLRALFEEGVGQTD
jgi:Uma2 family endonuclease